MSEVVDEQPAPSWHEIAAPTGQGASRLRHAATQFAVVVALAAVVGLLGHPRLTVVILAVGGSVTIAGLASEGFQRRFAAVVERIGHAVGWVLTVVVLGVFEAVIVLPVAALTYLLRVDLLAPGRGRHPVTLWESRLSRKRDLRHRLYADERSVVPTDASGWEKARRITAGFAAGLVFILVPAAIAYVVLREGEGTVREALGRPASPEQFDPTTTPALRNDPWADELHAEHNTLSLRDGYAPFTDYRLPTFHSDYINISDGERLTYVPPDTGDDPVDVWVFGGSAAWGVNQRDLHTIPSELARLAEQQGISVRVRNLAVVGFVNYQETLLLAERLAAGERPDLVVFYDGYNDVAQAREMLAAGTTSPDRFDTLFAPQFADMVTAVPGFDGVPSFAAVQDQATVADTAVSHYTQGVDLGRRLAAGYGFDAVYTWQPDFYSKQLVDGEDQLPAQLGVTDDYFDAGRQLSSTIRAQLPDGVIDLSGSLDGLTEPVLADQVHTNEAGAAAVAAALFDEIRPTLERLAGGG